MNLKQRKKIRGLSKERADIFLGAISIVKCLVNYTECPMVFVSGSGVREGLIYENMLKSNEPVSDVLEFSLNGLIQLQHLNKNHADSIWKLSSQLFMDLKPIHCLDCDVLKLLKTASMLCNIGIDVNYYNKNEHSYYMILNSKINGLTHKERLMVALIVSMLKKEGIQSDIIEYRELLSENEINAIHVLALVLKLSVDLNLRKKDIIKLLKVNIYGDTVAIRLTSDKNVMKEISTAMGGALFFEKLFNRKLIINQ